MKHIAVVDPVLGRTRDAGQVLGVSDSQVAKFERAGLLTPIRIPGLRAKRYDMAEVRALAEQWIAATHAHA
ncbi:MAG TPA: hypothetical protein VFX12_01345 [Vicinamibacterales bacterium]|nr:hypothetical protein [Vicinamibacterales bacterium]